MLIAIDTLGALPIYEQLRNQIVRGIACGKLVEGEALPSVRRLAADLGINFHTVNKGYTMLCDEGYIVMDRRKGAVVAARGSADGVDTGFLAELSRKLILASAESVCHGLDESEFLRICKEAYGKALE